MKKIVTLILILCGILLLTSCDDEDTEKEVVSMEYTTVDFMGGYTKVKKIDFSDGALLGKGYKPNDEDEPDFDNILSFETNDIGSTLSALQNTGLFELKEMYKPDGIIMDGGSWELIVTYKDGTTRTAKGENEWPIEVFSDADYLLFDLYGGNFFGTLPSSYLNPPTLNVSVKHSTENGTSSMGRGLTPVNYSWHNYEDLDNNIFESPFLNTKFEFHHEFEYVLSINTSNDVYDIDEIDVYQYDLDGSNKTLIPNPGMFSKKEYELEKNHVYLFIITWEHGTCEYALSTIVN